MKVPNMICANGHFKPFLCLCGAAQHPSVEDQVVNDRCCGLDSLHPRLDVIQGGQVQLLYRELTLAGDLRWFADWGRNRGWRLLWQGHPYNVGSNQRSIPPLPTFTPSACSRSTTLLPASTFLDVNTTSAPAPANARTVSTPIPALPPVTTATLPVRSTPRTTSCAVLLELNRDIVIGRSVDLVREEMNTLVCRPSGREVALARDRRLARPGQNLGLARVLRARCST